MPLAKTEGVILKRIRLGETSKILTVLTPEYGKVRLVAKGARKPRHRFGSSMEPFMVCGIVFYHREGRDLQLLSQCDTLQAFPQFSGDLVRLAYGSGVLELADRVVYGAESSGDLYALVVETIGLMAEAVRADLPLFWWVYQLKTAERVGYLPELGRCDRCGRQISGGRVLFSPEAGSVRCAKCGGGGEMSVSAGSLRALQFLSQADWGRVTSLRVSRRQAGEIENLLGRFLVGQFGESLRIKSLGILRSIPRERTQGARGCGLSNADHAVGGVLV